MSGGPIFVGGTGRSGTSIMGDLLASHPAIVLPAHENKLIVERNGLRDLVDSLSGRYDMKRRHYALAGFIRWARTLRALGFRDAKLNAELHALRTEQKMAFHKACEAIARRNPGAELSIHAVGHGFDPAHYDRAVNAFLAALKPTVLVEGIVDTEGLIKPFYLAEATDRTRLLETARAFLADLYSLPLERASASRWCDDTPSNWLYGDFLFELHPNMRLIHMIRDPRDVVGSYLKQVWSPPDPKVIVAMFKAQFADYRRIAGALPRGSVLDLRMEDITADRDAALDRLADFLGVENRFNAGLFAEEKTNTGNYADQLGAETLALIEAELADWMAEFGYTPAA